MKSHRNRDKKIWDYENDEKRLGKDNGKMVQTSSTSLPRPKINAGVIKDLTRAVAPGNTSLRPKVWIVM